MRRCAFLLLLMVAAHLSASDFERVLLPITVLQIPGAHGSSWQSDLWAHVRVDGVVIRPLRIAHVTPLRAGTQTVPVFLHRIGEPPGQFIEVTSALLDDVELNLRVRDSSREHETWGTEIPIVRERDFHREAIALVPIPAGDARFRSMLRIYGANGDGAAVRVRLTLVATPLAPARVIHESTHTFEPAISPYQPAYLELSLDPLAGREDGGVVRVDVEPLTPGLRFWAFASITHNETQHFTTITPQ